LTEFPLSAEFFPCWQSESSAIRLRSGARWHSIALHMVRAPGRVFAHLSQDQLAARAGIHRDCLRTWEGSSDAVPRAQYRTLCRLIDALEDAGVRFSDGGVHLQRTVAFSDDRPPAMKTVISREAAA
jgi:hypothetical protein